MDALSHWRAARTLAGQRDFSGFRQRVGQSADLAGAGGKLGCLGCIDHAVCVDRHRLPLDQLAGLAGMVIPGSGDHLVSAVGMADRESGVVWCRRTSGRLVVELHTVAGVRAMAAAVPAHNGCHRETLVALIDRLSRHRSTGTKPRDASGEPIPTKPGDIISPSDFLTYGLFTWIVTIKGRVGRHEFDRQWGAAGGAFALRR